MPDNKTQETLELSCYLVNTYADYTFKAMEKNAKFDFKWHKSH